MFEETKPAGATSRSSQPVARRGITLHSYDGFGRHRSDPYNFLPSLSRISARTETPTQRPTIPLRSPSRATHALSSSGSPVGFGAAFRLLLSIPPAYRHLSRPLPKNDWFSVGRPAASGISCDLTACRGRAGRPRDRHAAQGRGERALGPEQVGRLLSAVLRPERPLTRPSRGDLRGAARHVQARRKGRKGSFA
jgi:hypothetical protein